MEVPLADVEYQCEDSGGCCGVVGGYVGEGACAGGGEGE